MVDNDLTLRVFAPLAAVDPQYIYSRGRSIWHSDVTIPQGSPTTIEMTLTPFITDVYSVQALAFHYKWVQNSAASV